MAMENKLSFYFKKFFRKEPLGSINSDKEKKIKSPKGMETELQDLKSKFSQFLITRKKESGTILERKNYKVTKNSEKLFRLEGKEKDGFEYSILISTGSYLALKENKVTGLAHLSEADLNRALSYEHSSLKSFFSRIKDINFDESSLIFLDKDKRFEWKEILDWGLFWQEQIFIRLSANQVALLLVSLEDVFYELFEKVATKKQKKIISEELFFLNQGVNSEEMNPHTKNKNLYDFDYAMSELKKVTENLRTKREKS